VDRRDLLDQELGHVRFQLFQLGQRRPGATAADVCQRPQDVAGGDGLIG
jgi:hypothetical protein